jgi:hypothetical protein
LNTIGDGSVVNVTVAVGIAVFVGDHVAVLVDVVADVGVETKVAQLTNALVLRTIINSMNKLGVVFNLISTRILYRLWLSAERLALPAGGREETTLFCRNQLQAKYTAEKRGESHPSGARCVGRLSP